TPIKRAWIWHYQRDDRKIFIKIGNILNLNPSVVSRNFNKLERQGSDPDFYAKTSISERPRLITPHAE
ncbi:hypothetical protein DFP72DRAFT_820871, partial [Ephemerocybe angulata]